MRLRAEKLLPFLQWAPSVDRQTLRVDGIAGVTGAILVLPQGVAFATIAGMPPQYGLYAAMVPAIIAALFGSSRQLVSGPTTAASVVLFSALSALAVPGSAEYVALALTLTFMVGVLQLAMGLARLGALVNFISHSVIIGFTTGAGLLIAASQLKNFFGLEIPSGLQVHQVLLEFFSRLGEIHPYAVMVGLATLASGILSRRWFPRFPYMITALVVGTLVAVAINRFLYVGPVTPGLATVGEIPASLPPLSSPEWSFSTFQQLAPAALAMTLFALTEAVSIARSMAARTGDLIDGNQEFVGQGLSNVIGAFFSSYVATGSFNRSAVNFQAGARTPISAIIAALLLMLIVLFVAPLLRHLPNAAMAAILFLVAWGIIDVAHMRRIARASRSDAMVLWGTFLATLFLALDFAILLGVFLSLVIYLHQASRPRVLVQVPDPRVPGRQFTTDPALDQCPQLKIVRIEGSLFFGAVNYVAERLRVIAKRNPEQKHLLVLARSVTYMDVAGAEMLAREQQLRRASCGQLYLHELSDSGVELLRRGGYLDEIGEQNLFATKGEAVRAIFQRLDRGICVTCDKRIFNECRSIPRVEVETLEAEEIELLALEESPARS
jgi:sulfate permease, SulP family